MLIFIFATGHKTRAVSIRSVCIAGTRLGVTKKRYVSSRLATLPYRKWRVGGSRCPLVLASEKVSGRSIGRPVP